MRTPSTPFDFRALFECRVTTTVLVASITLSILRLQGSDMNALIAQSGTWKTQPWTLVTSTLLHGNYMHLAFNVYWTALFGMAVESAFGALATAGFMLLFAVCSSAPQVALAGGGIGLSGIGYALFGFLWVLSRFDPRYRGCIDSRTAIWFVGWFFLCIVLDATDTMPIGNIAHGAGAVVGAATGWAVADTSRSIAARAAPLFLTLSAIVLSCTVLQSRLMSPSAREANLSLEGYQALQAGDYARAEPLLLRAAEANAGEWTNWWMLGKARWELGRYDEALIAMDGAARLHALDPEYVHFLSEARAWRQRTHPSARAPK